MAGPATAATSAPTEAPRAPDNYSLDMLSSVVWSRTSSEAEALYLQAYAGAQKQLDAALADKTWTAATEQSGDVSRLPPAIIVDIDETVLDTSDYMLEQIRGGHAFDKLTWNHFVYREIATPLPGALDFLKAAAAKGVTVFYVSNRELFDENVENAKPEAERLRDEITPTRSNLHKFGFPNTDSDRTFLLRDKARGWSEKGPRRAEIAKTHRIIMLAGDNLYDFVDLPEGVPATRAARDLLIEDHRNWLGTRWVMLPNPMYGSWETWITNGKTGADARRVKLEAIGIPAGAADVIASGGFEP
jgi:acid phosphatase